MNAGPMYAIAAAILFGFTTPVAKLLSSNMSPQMLAGLFYAGSGIGLLTIYGLIHQLNPNHVNSNPVSRTDLPWLAGAILFGGVLAPVLLMHGLLSTPASMASLLLNLESVLTALIAWFIFHEHVDRRIMVGMLCIVLGGLVLSWPKELVNLPWGAIAIAAACACWAIDNNLTRKIAASDALQVVGIKGMVAGMINLSMALMLGSSLPAASEGIIAAMIGLAGYGISLVLFVIALRHIGTARTGAYFSVAPFIGAAISLLWLHEQPNPLFWIAAALMAVGIWLHLTEQHAHEHHHGETEHQHSHVHDEHHQHTHSFEWSGERPHVHPHRHAPLTHSHAHFPDLHHDHDH